MLKFFGQLLDSNEREIKKLQPIVEATAAFEPELKKLSAAKLKKQTEDFKKRLEKGETLDDLLPEAFATVREAFRRTLGVRPYDVQIMGGTVLHQGKIAEMRTGEGKTFVATLPLYLNSLVGKGAHLVTVNDYLARRDAEWVGPVFHLLGVSVGVINHEKSYLYDPNPKTKEDDAAEVHLTAAQAASPDLEGIGIGRFLREVTRTQAYGADITYGTNNEYGFDYLRDNMADSLDNYVQRGHHYAIVDEVDSILIDEARTPLIISAPAEESTEKYYEFSRLVDKLTIETDFVVDEKMRTASLTEIGIAKIEKLLGVDNLYEKDFETIHHLEEALKSKTLFFRDRDYVVKDGEVIIVDEFTGRMLPGRRYSEGLHQAIEAKEGVEIQRESRTLATISFQNYFRLYEKLAGMTGTATTSAEEFHKVYTLDVITVPTNKPMIRKDLPDAVYKTTAAKYEAIVKDVVERHKKGQPVLVATIDINKNQLLSDLLKRKGIPHELLNAKSIAEQDDRESKIIASAGQKGAVTVATNIAGRGVDIKLGEGADKAGGLHIIGSERHDARRIDNQLRGRSGRQGDPGSSQFYVSLQDDLMKLFGGDTVAGLMNALKIPDDVPIENPVVSKSIESAQSRVEGQNFDSRKRVVEYDDVMNKQREVIYSLRREILELGDPNNENKEEAEKKLREMVFPKIEEEIEVLVDTSLAETKIDLDINHLTAEYFTILPFDEASQKEVLEEVGKKKSSPEEVKDYLKGLAKKVYETREAALGREVSRQIEKLVLISVIDTLWINHLEDIDDLREGIGLRGYAQRDPLVEYKAEAYKLFEDLMDAIDYETVHRIFKVQVQTQPTPPAVQTTMTTSSGAATESHAGHNHPVAEAVLVGDKIGRNDPCPCGSGLKYKKCGLVNSPTHQENMAKA
ncbi:MAG: preprotein translocase subunit SecA [bacterium]|nr:preprotein translocase subunit SecA [bacterium]